MSEPMPAAIVRGQAARPSHRLVTVPAGLVLFACMFLPTSSSCGHVARPLAHPHECWPYVLAAAAAVAALLSRAAAPERWTAILVMVLAGATSVLLLAALSMGHALIGGELALAAGLWLAIGGALWERDVERAAADPGRAGAPPSAWRVAVACVALISYGVIAATAPREPPPRPHDHDADDGAGSGPTAAPTSWPSVD